jgi:hypothetical protein
VAAVGNTGAFMGPVGLCGVATVRVPTGTVRGSMELELAKRTHRVLVGQRFKIDQEIDGLKAALAALEG